MDSDDGKGHALSADDRAYVEARVRESGTSFYWAMRFLPKVKREAMFAIYAFCREVDDVADDPGDTTTKQTLLHQWRQAVEQLFRGRGRCAITRALLEPAQRFGFEEKDFQAIIDGMEMDARERVRVADMDELVLYCDRVACAVGRLSNRVFGVDRGIANPLAGALGQALQLTNILRDLEEDAERDRLYLPADRLAAEGIAEIDDLRAVLDHPASAKVCEGLAAIAAERFAEAQTLIAGCDRRQIRPAVMMMEVYRRTLSRLRVRGWRRWTEPVSVSSAEKLWVAVRHGVI
jgi:phytoene synthase